jgi:hypothetical protein
MARKSQAEKDAASFLDLGRVEPKALAPIRGFRRKKQLNGLAIGMETIDRLLRAPENREELQRSFQALFRDNPIKASFVAATLAEKLQRAGILGRYFDVGETVQPGEKPVYNFTFNLAENQQVNNAGDPTKLPAPDRPTFPAEE